jgi:hypothetical protein
LNAGVKTIHQSDPVVPEEESKPASTNVDFGETHYQMLIVTHNFLPPVLNM